MLFWCPTSVWREFSRERGGTFPFLFRVPTYVPPNYYEGRWAKKQKQAAPPLRVIDEQVFYITLSTDGEEGNMGRRRGGGLLDTTFVLWPEKTIFPHSRVIHESTPENAPHHATTTTFKSFYMVFMRNGSFLRPSSFLRTFPVESAYRVKQVNYFIPCQWITLIPLHG